MVGDKIVISMVGDEALISIAGDRIVSKVVEYKDDAVHLGSFSCVLKGP